ncbi:unnamed protein product [Thelazia callipaeda]|uniref:G_PROTEIN_RECEP_F1_2 domain-containing protein n=1 Tax=Thelazia callipaeda TaxID=103827 RepID=A0A0N5D8P6_THECL|nr:unnamed protein product [Thelazia callipaeda]
MNISDASLPGDITMLDKASLICTLVMLWMCLCGIIGNMLSLYIYSCSSFRNCSINILLAALSASDLFLCILAIPVFSLPQIQQYFADLSRYISGNIVIYAYPVTLMFQSLSVWLLVSITIDRYLAVCHPFTARIYCTKKRAWQIVIIIIAFSIAYNFVRFWEFRIDESAEYLLFQESIVPKLRSNPMFMLLYQNIATLLTQFFIPLILLFYLNLHVAQTILVATEQRKKLVASERREYSIAKMMICIVIVFIFCYTLSMVLNLIEVFNGELFRQPIGYLLNDVNNILVVINSSSSFIFYIKYSTR